MFVQNQEMTLDQSGTLPNITDLVNCKHAVERLLTREVFHVCVRCLAPANYSMLNHALWADHLMGRGAKVS